MLGCFAKEEHFIKGSPVRESQGCVTKGNCKKENIKKISLVCGEQKSTEALTHYHRGHFVSESFKEERDDAKKNWLKGTDTSLKGYLERGASSGGSFGQGVSQGTCKVS